MSDLISLHTDLKGVPDPYNLYDVYIDSEAWIQDRCGEPLPFESNGDWMANQEDEIIALLESRTGQKFTCGQIDNTYNRETDFSTVFQMQCFYPEGERDWIYSNQLYVAIEVHNGGDVRGNYGPVRVYRPVDGERLFDEQLSFRCLTTQDEEMMSSRGDPYERGYMQSPKYALSEDMKTLNWSARHNCFVGWHKPSGRAVKIEPFFY